MDDHIADEHISFLIPIAGIAFHQCLSKLRNIIVKGFYDFNRSAIMLFNKSCYRICIFLSFIRLGFISQSYICDKAIRICYNIVFIKNSRVNPEFIRKRSKIQ